MKDIKQSIEESMNLNETKSEWTDGGREYAWSPTSKYIQINTLYKDEKYYLFHSDASIENDFDEDDVKNIQKLKPGELYDPGYGDENVIIRFK